MTNDFHLGLSLGKLNVFSAYILGMRVKKTQKLRAAGIKLQPKGRRRFVTESLLDTSRIPWLNEREVTATTRKTGPT